jgi:glycosyltransferase involved in cell wall biosynthesis
VPPNEPHILTSTIIDLYEHPEKRKKIGENGMRRAKERHDRIKIKKDLLNIYSEIINKKNNLL